jgi:thiamine biosynthesis lipoprotein
VRLDHGVAVTLNGIAQGYITDRVADLLRARGWSNVLVDLGELRALDGHIDGTPWQITIPGNGADDPWLPLTNGALATSASYGTVLDRAGRFGHLFDPRRGWVEPRYRSVTVLARDATTADALSTAFALMPPESIADVARAVDLAAVWTVDLGEHRQRLHG